MTAPADLERLYERVQFVCGKGNRRHGRLCVMSFVALLAGERHTDAPDTASPFIRHFAINLNDAMPEAERQRLKLFAPRIVGTNDGLDTERTWLVQRVFRDEIVPQLRHDLADRWLPKGLGGDWGVYAAGPVQSPQEFIFQIIAGTGQGAGSLTRNRTAVLAAKLLVECATTATPAASRPWYWAKSIEMLDRLCDVGATDSRFCIGPGEIARAEHTLDHARRFEELSGLIAAAFRAVRLRLGRVSASAAEATRSDAGTRHIVHEAASGCHSLLRWPQPPCGGAGEPPPTAEATAVMS